MLALDLLDPSNWTPVTAAQQVFQTPVYTVRPWEQQASGVYSAEGTNPHHPNPYVLINPKAARRVTKVLTGHYSRNQFVPLAFSTLLHEMTHARGYEHTGFAGTNDFQRETWKATEDFLRRAKLPPSYRRWLTRQLRYQIQNVTWSRR